MGNNKAAVVKFIQSIGGTAHYSGKTRTMYIKNDPHPFYCDIEERTIARFGRSLEFRIHETMGETLNF